MFLSIRCRSNHARIGKKSDKFGRPKISTMFADTVCNSDARWLLFFSLSDVLPQIKLVRTFVCVMKVISLMSIGVPILLNTFLMVFLTSSILKDPHASRFLLLRASWTNILRSLRQFELFMDHTKSWPP
ncbi:hypothetical protein HanRHA438_Chr05g0220751 [Helianthus annuus]|nr:hypothetical protein HanRHA438_Chr05g0220751 [Helianthus annuus]